MYLIDTDTLIHILRGNPDVIASFSTVSATTPLSAAAITAAELYHGAARSADPPRRTAEVAALLSRLDVLPVDETVAARFGVEKAALQRRGMVIADFDLLIASTALVHALTVVTHNTRDFSRIPGLSLVDWVT